MICKKVFKLINKILYNKIIIQNKIFNKKKIIIYKKNKII